MNEDQGTVTALCPECGDKLKLGAKPYQGQKLTCPNCWASLEVVSLTPLELAWETVESEEDGSLDWNSSTQ